MTDIIKAQSVDGVELPEPDAYWYRPISTEGEPMGAWKPVEPRNLHMNTASDTVRELLAHRYKDKPGYEVMPVHTATTVRRLIAEAVEREREECAKVCEQRAGTASMFANSKAASEHNRAVKGCAAAIRARGEK